MKDMIPLLRPYFDNEELEEVKKVLESGWVSQGPKSKEFEEMVKEYISTNHAISLTNCTSALHLALLGLGVTKGDEVLVADFTYPATGHSVVYCGARPVFVDIDPLTYNMNPELLEDKITERTKAVIPVHTFGQPARMDEILKIAQNHDLKIIEDAACAFGAKYKGKPAGTMGDIGCFSFHARKGITTGEGGMAVTDSEALARKMRQLSVFGIKAAWDREDDEGFVVPEFVEFGYNYKMSDIIAAVGVAQLRKLDMIIENKLELANYWNNKLEEIHGIKAPHVDKDVLHVFQSYVAVLDKGINRNKLIDLLKKKGIQAQIGTYASHVQPVYKSTDECPVSLEIFNRTIALPFYYSLEKEEIDDISIKLKKSLEELRA